MIMRYLGPVVLVGPAAPNRACRGLTRIAGIGKTTAPNGVLGFLRALEDPICLTQQRVSTFDRLSNFPNRS
jgi:hypothetical protein